MQIFDYDSIMLKHHINIGLCVGSFLHTIQNQLLLCRLLSLWLRNLNLPLHLRNFRYQCSNIAVRFKTISINMLTMVWAGTPIFLPLLSFLPSWRTCFFFFALLWLITLPFAYFCFLESPRFLLSKKCYSQVRDIFEQISITNRRPPYKFKLAE